ncbi:hypothetical protein AU255_12820 [Methyloprofundus sedimenti]|uniref:HNH nuclease domain-containing protein n=1 Tax=Methyloprofundus sedimenti TaxID=1420851 RepID=A0A1V8M3A7_9GAMM|nr:HNH endonuclease [Methyloprofundus sedimenti]OQK15998.1 hypothetical protein AU255_12820 [Methyloprofundus sedimenti]
MTWKEAAIQALTRMSLRHHQNVFSRTKIIEEELKNITRDVGSIGATPTQTLSRVLQELRDEGYLDFDGHGGYTLLNSASIPESSDIPDEYSIPDRTPTTVHRIIRDPKIVSELKRLYSFRCQLCGIRIELPSGYYCEAHHLKPLGSPHNGPDSQNNLIIACPNHHVMLDYGSIELNKSILKLNNHNINQVFFDYHNRYIYRAESDKRG